MSDEPPLLTDLIGLFEESDYKIGDGWKSDMDQAIETIEAMKHWTIKTRNRGGQRVGYECTLWDNKKRVSAQGQTPLAAVTAAMKKLQPEPVTKLRVVG